MKKTKQGQWINNQKMIRKEKQRNHQEGNILMIVSKQYNSVISLNVNGLNFPVKRYRLAHWIKKQNPKVCCIHKIHLIQKDIHRLKIKC